MDVSIVIVNWNSKEFLRDCIASLDVGAGALSFEIVVIDSGSFDGCHTVLDLSRPNLHFIQSDTNLGFARANNEAFKACHGENILFLNPDTVVIGFAIETLHQQLCSLPSTGLVGAKLLNRDGTIQTTYIRAFPTILNQVLESEMFRGLFPRSRLWGTAPLFDALEGPCEVDAVSGACVMIKRSVFESVGMFSAEYFMYSEDIDLCYKARRDGWKTYYIPTAVVTHYGGESSSKSPVSVLSSVMMLESRWRFFVKTRSRWYGNLYRLFMGMASMVRIGIAVILWPLGVLAGRRSRVEVVLRNWTARLRWAFGGEKWVKTYPPSKE
jgi:N-acetylglucosaminyl-diphospho-decaprenol L-rhamnosyltransferase